MKIIWYNEHLRSSSVLVANLATTIYVCWGNYRCVYVFLLFSKYLERSRVETNILYSDIDSVCKFWMVKIFSFPSSLLNSDISEVIILLSTGPFKNGNQM